jgi:hypothetical protein
MALDITVPGKLLVGTDEVTEYRRATVAPESFADFPKSPDRRI